MNQSLCELRPGIGLCDECALPNWPQQYVGYGHMLCLDCLARWEEDNRLRDAQRRKRRTRQASR